MIPLLGLFSASCSDSDTAQEPGKPEVPENPEPKPEPEPIAGCSLWEAYLSGLSAGEETALPDFSYAGYEYGERASRMPTIPCFW